MHYHFHGYNPLPTGVDDDKLDACIEDCEDSRSRKTRQCLPSYTLLLWIVAMQTCMLAALLLVVAKRPSIRYDHPLYSPAEDAVSYRYVRFFNGFQDDTSSFQAPPSKELDDRWRELYNFGMSRIPRSQAERLPNKTEEIPGDEGHFMVELDVFHQLHCLNRIRQALYPEHYPGARMDDPLTERHINHCLDGIRQSLMCSADISTNVMQWNETAQVTIPMFNVVHRCRDFDRIKDWALQRRTIVKFNLSRHVESHLEIPLLY